MNDVFRLVNRMYDMNLYNFTNMNNVFRLVNRVYDRNLYIFKVNVFANQSKYE